MLYNFSFPGTKFFKNEVVFGILNTKNNLRYYLGFDSFFYFDRFDFIFR